MICPDCGRTFTLPAHLANHRKSHRGVTATYRGMHERVRAVRGAPSGPCAAPHCERAATQWAWLHTGPSATGMTGGRAVEYGTDPEDYAAVCRGHNGMMDGGGTWTHCRRGHERAVAGVDSDGRCCACRGG